jgi:hypothetical protein
MKPWVLCLLLLPACWYVEPSYDPETYEYVLTWYCVSREGCERTEELTRIDRASLTDYEIHFTSTQDPSFDEEGAQLFLDSLPSGCSWIYYLTFAGHDLERSMHCYNPAGFELQLSIPNQDPTTFSKWVVSGRDTRFL